MNVILLGPPGAGKGTMAEYVRGSFHLAHISTGDMLRDQMHAGTQLGMLAKDYIEKGILVPDDVIISMLEKRMQHEDAKHGALLDGFPRTTEQAEALKHIAEIHCVIVLDASEELVVERISSRRLCGTCGTVHSVKHHPDLTCKQCGSDLYHREDDKEETVRKRYAVYLEQTSPLIDYYNQQGIVTRIDADQPVEDEVAQITEVLKNLTIK